MIILLNFLSKGAQSTKLSLGKIDELVIDIHYCIGPTQTLSKELIFVAIQAFHQQEQKFKLTQKDNNLIPGTINPSID